MLICSYIDAYSYYNHSHVYMYSLAYINSHDYMTENITFVIK